MRVLAINIADGFSPEVRVMMTLFGNAPSIRATIVNHGWDGGPDCTSILREYSGADVREIDFGWRPSGPSFGGSKLKVSSALRATVAIPLLIRLGRRSHPDIIYSSQQKWDCLFASIVAFALRRPQVVHVHFRPSPWLGRFVMRRLKRADLVIGVSRWIRDLAIASGTDPDRAVVVLNPVPAYYGESDTARRDLRVELGISDDEVAVGFVGRLTPWKGLFETIRAFSELGKDLCRSRLIVVGDGDTRVELEELSRSLGLAERVTFTGWRDDVPSLLRAFDVFVHPSYDEAFGLAVVEAQAAGLPTVAFNEGATPEIVVDGETGLLAPNRDASELAIRLSTLIGDPLLRERMGRAAAERARTSFAPSLAGDRFAAALERVGRGGRNGA